MRSRFSFLVLAAALAAAPAFARNDATSGRWDGVLVRNGAQTPISVELREDDGIWRGRLEVDGASSPLDSLRVDDNSVQFELPNEGVFEGKITGNSMTGSLLASRSNGSDSIGSASRGSASLGSDSIGSLSMGPASKGSDSKGSFTLSREEAPKPFGDPIESSGP